jgi:hypothetical protein
MTQGKLARLVRRSPFVGVFFITKIMLNLVTMEIKKRTEKE